MTRKSCSEKRAALDRNAVQARIQNSGDFGVHGSAELNRFHHLRAFHYGKGFFDSVF